MERANTIILLAPSGAGKTTFIEDMKKNGIEFTHIDRDKIIEQEIRNRQRESTGGYLGQEDLKAVLDVADQVYSELFCAAIKEKAHVVVDYPPSSSGTKLAIRAVTLSELVGRKVVVEGITSNPEVTLPRFLQRTSNGLDMVKLTPDIMKQDGIALRSWLTTYQTFSDEFLEVAAKADIAKLHDNNGDYPKLIAEWCNGDCRIIDASAYAEFERLRDVDPEYAHFEARVANSEIENGVLTHTFETTAFEFFGASKPTTTSPQVTAQPALL